MIFKELIIKTKTLAVPSAHEIRKWIGPYKAAKILNSHQFIKGFLVFYPNPKSQIYVHLIVEITNAGVYFWMLKYSILIH